MTWPEAFVDGMGWIAVAGFWIGFGIAMAGLFIGIGIEGAADRTKK